DLGPIHAHVDVAELAEEDRRGSIDDLSAIDLDFPRPGLIDRGVDFRRDPGDKRVRNHVIFTVHDENVIDARRFLDLVDAGLDRGGVAVQDQVDIGGGKCRGNGFAVVDELIRSTAIDHHGGHRSRQAYLDNYRWDTTMQILTALFIRGARHA